MKTIKKVKIKKFEKQALQEKQTKQTVGGRSYQVTIDCLEC